MIEEVIDGTFYALVSVDTLKLTGQYNDDSFKDIKDKNNNAKALYRAFPDKDMSLTVEETLNRVRGMQKDDYNQRDYKDIHHIIALGELYR